MEPVRIALRADRTDVVLQGGLSIAQTRDTYRHLNEALVRGQPIFLDADKLERIDGAGAQLLLAFCRAAHARGITLVWQHVSGELSRVAEALGLAEVLGLVRRPGNGASA